MAFSPWSVPVGTATALDTADETDSPLPIGTRSHDNPP